MDLLMDLLDLQQDLRTSSYLSTHLLFGRLGPATSVHIVAVAACITRTFVTVRSSFLAGIAGLNSKYGPCVFDSGLRHD